MDFVAPIQEIHSPLLKARKVRLLVKREDLRPSLVSGNKWYKLKYNILEAQKQQSPRLLTFGGAFSNHIFAVASAGRQYGFPTVGIIRGEEQLPLNPILAHAQACGMKLHYRSRTEYRQKKEASFIAELHRLFGDFYLIPEGGTNALAICGTAEILEGIKEDYQYVCSPVGTGGTVAGLILGAQQRQPQPYVIGFSALKGDFLKDEVRQLLPEALTHWEIDTHYHFGGYAKSTPELLEFVLHFAQAHQIPIEPIYTGKMFYGIMERVQQGHFVQGSTLLAIHTGGIY